MIPVDCSELPSCGSDRVEITVTREFYSIQPLDYIFELIESPTTTTDITVTQPDTSISTTPTTTQTATFQSTTTVTEISTFPGVFVVLVVFGTLVIVTRIQK